MRRRLYFLLPDVKRARQVVKELLVARIEERYIHVLARDGVRLEGLPEASLFEKSDFVRGMGQGLVVGGATGAFAGVIAVVFPPAGLVMGLGIILATALAGAAMGVWVSGMIATDVPSRRLRAFAQAVARGKILMMVDLPKTEIGRVADMIHKRHPEASMRGIDPTIPAFP